MLRPQWRLIFDVSWKTWTDIMLNEIIFNALNHLKCKVEQMVYEIYLLWRITNFSYGICYCRTSVSSLCILFTSLHIFLYTLRWILSIGTPALVDEIFICNIYYDTVAITCCFGVNNKIRQTHKSCQYLLPFICTLFLHIHINAVIWPKYYR